MVYNAVYHNGHAFFSFCVGTEKAEHLDPHIRAVSKTDTGVLLETADFIKNALLFEFDPKLV